MSVNFVQKPFTDGPLKKMKLTGPLTTEETTKQINFWIRRAQIDVEETDTFMVDKSRLNLQMNEQHIYICMGRIQGEYPIYLPRNHILSNKVVEDAHMATLHGGVGLSMACVREKYWIPRLRQLSKKVLRKCFGCKRFQAIPFQVVDADFSDSIYYSHRSKSKGKCYIILYTCSLTRGLHLEILPNKNSCEELLAS